MIRTVENGAYKSNENSPLLFRQYAVPPTRASLTILLYSALALFASVISTEAQTSGDEVRLNAEQRSRRHFDAIPNLLTRRPPKLKLIPGVRMKGAQESPPPSPPYSGILLRAGTELVNDTINPEINTIFGGRAYTARLNTEKQAELKGRNEKLVTIYNELFDSRKRELEGAGKKILTTEPIKSKYEKFEQDYNQYTTDCTRTVPIEQLPAEQAKCDRRAEVLNMRAEALKKEINERYSAEETKINAKYEHGTPGMFEIQQMVKANFDLLLRLQDLERRVQANLAKFAELCPKAIAVNDAESLKYCAMFNWDNPNPDLTPLKDPKPRCEFFCR